MDLRLSDDDFGNFLPYATKMKNKCLSVSISIPFFFSNFANPETKYSSHYSSIYILVWVVFTLKTIYPDPEVF